MLSSRERLSPRSHQLIFLEGFRVLLRTTLEPCVLRTLIPLLNCWTHGWLLGAKNPSGDRALVSWGGCLCPSIRSMILAKAYQF